MATNNEKEKEQEKVEETQKEEAPASTNDKSKYGM
jgi:hypothetical protein